jgi:hypothetical protein
MARQIKPQIPIRLPFPELNIQRQSHANHVTDLPGMLSSTRPWLAVTPWAIIQAPSSLNDALAILSTRRLLLDSRALATYVAPSSPSPLKPRSKYVSTQRLCFRAMPKDRPAAASSGFHLGGEHGRGRTVTNSTQLRVAPRPSRCFAVLVLFLCSLGNQLRHQCTCEPQSC